MINTKEKHNPSPGFSLIELTIIAVILGILTGIGVPFFQRNWQQERLKVATRETANWLEDVRRRAIQQSQICAVQIIDSSAILQPNSATNSCIDVITLDLRSTVENANNLVVCSQSMLTPSTSSCTSGSGSQTTPTEIVFTPRGTVSQGGLIKLHLTSEIQNRCIALTQPLGTIRQGIEESGGCNFNTAF